MKRLPSMRNLNLLSARRYSIKLDIDETCMQLRAKVLQPKATRQPGLETDAGWEGHASVFREILLHLWPEPDDPVVVRLVASARLGLHYIELLRSHAALNDAGGAVAR